MQNLAFTHGANVGVGEGEHCGCAPFSSHEFDFESIVGIAMKDSSNIALFEMVLV